MRLWLWDEDEDEDEDEEVVFVEDDGDGEVDEDYEDEEDDEDNDDGETYLVLACYFVIKFCLLIKVKIVKEVIACDISPVAMFSLKISCMHDDTWWYMMP